MGKGKNVTTDKFYVIFTCQRAEKKTSLVEIMIKVRRELSASAKCLQYRYSGKLMKAGYMATLTVYQ